MNSEAVWLLQEKYHGVESEAFVADLVRLNNGEPLAYIIGHIPFLGCQIHLDSKPLIPRPETEYWVEKAIGEIKNAAASGPLNILDLCAGSGAIGVAVAKAIPEASITFAELDPAHLPTIQKNLIENLDANLGTTIIYDSSKSGENSENSTIIYDSAKYEVVESDLSQKITGKFDFILSNPPYIDPAVDRASESVKTHEPHLALYGGASGMEIIERIINEAPLHLKDSGELWLEHEPEQVEAINRLGAKRFMVISHEDQYGVKRYSTLKLLPAETMAK